MASLNYFIFKKTDFIDNKGVGLFDFFQFMGKNMLNNLFIQTFQRFFPVCYLKKQRNGFRRDGMIHD